MPCGRSRLQIYPGWLHVAETLVGDRLHQKKDVRGPYTGGPDQTWTLKLGFVDEPVMRSGEGVSSNAIDKLCKYILHCLITSLRFLVTSPDSLVKLMWLRPQPSYTTTDISLFKVAQYVIV